MVHLYGLARNLACQKWHAEINDEQSGRIRDLVYVYCRGFRARFGGAFRERYRVDSIESVRLPVDVLIEFWNVIFVVLLGFSVVAGLLALASPRVLAVMASYGNRSVFHGFRTRADKGWVDIDTFVIAHGRLFGLLVIAAVGYVWLILRHGPEVYSKSLLLTIVAITVMMGTFALRHIMRQSLEIQTHRAEAHADALTGLANRRAFDIELSRRLAQRQRQGTPLCLLIIDVDHFKTFNDEFGHLLGDVILQGVAKVLEATARQMDIVARLGGDEFAVLLPGSNLEAASHGAERIRSAIGDKPLQWEGQEHTLTVSIGLAEAQLDDDPASLLKRSDSALYAAKEAGRNCAFRQGNPEPAAPIPCKRLQGRSADGSTSAGEEKLKQESGDEASPELLASDPS